MSELSDLYQEVILDHNKSPRNFGRCEHPTCSVEGYNPLCGDHYWVHLTLDGDTIAEVKVEGSGCAISKASASLMTTVVKGQNRETVERLFHRFHDLVTGVGEPADYEDLGKLQVFGGVRDYPMRVKCASLAWHTLHAALEGQHVPVSTE